MAVEDAEGLYAIRSDERAMRFMDSVWHKSVEDSKQKIEEIREAFRKKEGINWSIIEKGSGLFIGYFGYWRLERHNSRAEIGYALVPDHWGKGFMTEALSSLLTFGFDVIKLHSMEANINPNNAPSRKLLLKSGFRQEAYFRENYFYEGKFIDSEIYGLLKSDLK